ncbi:MAG: DVU_1553 family AMP-dependent CoA ligase [Desulfobacterales bacterium]
MNSIPVTPLERWIARRIGLPPTTRPERRVLDVYRLQKLRETLACLVEKSPFYRGRLSGSGSPPLRSLADLPSLPFTTPEDLRRNPLSFLCASQSQIARVVTLRSSGTTGAPKRIFFTEEDLELTRDFFRVGMSTLAHPGDRVLVLLPGNAPSSVGDLLLNALSRMKTSAWVHGPVSDPEAVRAIIRERDIDALVGIPVQVLALARSANSFPPGRIKTVLLTTDYVPEAVVEELIRSWGCKVFQHYGMSEMGYGGGVECGAFSGYHLRDADLLVEIVDPSTGDPLPEGETGEVVFTTLTRRGMPLLRYRTGDLAALTSVPCPCGSVLQRLTKIRGRIRKPALSGSGLPFDLPDLDEAILRVDGVVSYQAEIYSGIHGDHLLLTVFTGNRPDDALLTTVTRALMKVRSVTEGVARGNLILDPPVPGCGYGLDAGTTKRQLIDHRQRQKDAPHENHC